MRCPFALLPLMPFLLAACGAEDRSGEQPFAPTVENVAACVDGNSCLLSGKVTASPNSSLRRCGFLYGNDTLRVEAVAELPVFQFTVATRQLQPGRYFAVAFAENGVGKSYAPDTLLFDIGK